MTLNARAIVIAALKMEASMKPNEQIIAGPVVMTYKEFASKINTGKKLTGTEKRFVKEFLNHSVEMFNRNPDFQAKMMRLAGAEPC